MAYLHTLNFGESTKEIRRLFPELKKMTMFFGSSKKNLPVNEEVIVETGVLLNQISPLVRSIHSSTAVFFLGKGVNGLLELVLYLLGLAVIAFIFLMDTVFPFHVLKDINTQAVYHNAIQGEGDIRTFTLAVKGLVVLIGLLIISIGLMIRRSGNRRDVLQQAGAGLKATETYLLKLQKQMVVPEAPPAPSGNAGIDMTRVPPQV